MNRERRRGVLALAALLAACAGVVPPVRPRRPDVSLNGVELLAAGARTQRFRLFLGIRNPNPFALDLSDVRFSVALDGTPFAQGAHPAPVHLPAEGEVSVAVEIDSDLSRLLRLGRAWWQAGRPPLPYRLEGSAVVAGVGALPFVREGTVRPGAALGGR